MSGITIAFGVLSMLAAFVMLVFALASVNVGKPKSAAVCFALAAANWASGYNKLNEVVPALVIFTFVMLGVVAMNWRGMYRERRPWLYA